MKVNSEILSNDGCPEFIEITELQKEAKEALFQDSTNKQKINLFD